MNLSKIESVQFQIFGADLFDSNAYKIGHGIGITLCLVTGSIFYGGTIVYERYGGDPMKRSLRNKLIASLAFVVMILQVFAIGFAWRMIVCPLNARGWFLHLWTCAEVRIGYIRIG